MRSRISGTPAYQDSQAIIFPAAGQYPDCTTRFAVGNYAEKRASATTPRTAAKSTRLRRHRRQIPRSTISKNSFHR